MRVWLIWMSEQIGEETLLVLLSLLAVLISFNGMVLDQVTGVSFRDLATVYLLAFPAGWWVGRRRLGVWAPMLIGLSSGFLVTFGSIGQLFSPFVRLARIWIMLFVQISRWRWTGPLDLAPFFEASQAFFLDLSVVLNRAGAWILGIVSGNYSNDILVIGLAWSILLWLTTYWIGWTYNQWRRPLITLSPPGVVLSVVLVFAAEEPNKIIPFLGAALVLLLVTHLGDLRAHWEVKRIDYPTEVWLELSGVGVALIVLLLGLALLVPSLNWENIVELFQTSNPASASGRGLAAGSELEARPPAEDNFRPFRLGGLPRNHLIGSGPELRERIVMEVALEETSPEGDAQRPDGLPPLYWRGFTFERYSGLGWFNGPTNNISYASGDTIRDIAHPGYRLVQEEFQYFEDFGGVLYVGGHLAGVNKDYEIAWRSPPTEVPEEFESKSQPRGDIFGALVVEANYQVQAYIPQVSEAQLRAAGTVYPTEIQTRYLALPETIPPRVLSLARELTATKPTPYDRATAIETFLRTFPYTLTLPSPPTDQDVVDYFLFDLRKGYCDYYATAMVVLSRAAGLPARLVMGYASGDYDFDRGKYLVSEADAHSWVEIYFPSIGWIEFEPTAGLPAISRPSTSPEPTEAPRLENPLVSPGGLYALVDLIPAGIKLLLILAISGLVVIVGGFLIFWGGSFVTVWRFRRLPPSKSIETIFQNLYAQGRNLALSLGPGSTAIEFQKALERRLMTLAQNTGWRGDLAKPIEALDLITEIHIHSLFSPRSAGAKERITALRSWIHLNRFLLLARFWQWRVARGLGGGKAYKKQ